MFPFKQKLKIVSFGDLESGCWVARIRRPMEELARHGHKIKMQGDGIVSYDTDIVIFNNLMDGPLEDMITDFKEHGIKIIYDCDDAQDIHPHFLLHTWNIEKCIYSFDLLLKNADLITTTTPELAKYLGEKTNKPIKVLPNCLDPEEFPARKKFKRLRVGLAGSLSHAEDLLSVIDQIIALKKKYDFVFVLFGFNKQGWKDWLNKCRRTPMEPISKELDQKLREIDFVCEAAVSADDYPGKLAELGLDIGLCPLIDNQFDRNKSCIKFYEYSLVGTCAVASDVLPFSREPVTKWNDLERLIADADFRISETKRQREWVMENRNIKKSWKLWEKTYKNICLK